MKLPSNAPLERVAISEIIGIALPTQVTQAMLTLEAADFTDLFCRDTFKKCKQIFEAGNKIAPASLLEAGVDLDSLSRIAQEGGEDLSYRLPEAVEKLRDLRKRREFILAADIATKQAAEGGEYMESMTRAVDSILSIDTAKGRDNSEIYDDAVAALLGERSTVLDIGFDEFNLVHGGISNGDLVIVAGRPSMGKSALAQQLAWNVAKQDKVSIYFSLEMSDAQILSRTIVAETGINRKAALINPNKARQAFDRARSKIASKPFFIADRINSLDGIYSECHRVKRLKKRLDLVVIDYLQLMQMPQSKNNTRDREIGIVTGRLKQLARELEVPIILLSQLNRSVESRTDKRPLMSDLRESGNIEQDADIVTFLYRDAYYTRDPNDHSAEWIVAKNRNGNVGVVNLEWDGELCKFTEKEVMPWTR